MASKAMDNDFEKLIEEVGPVIPSSALESWESNSQGMHTEMASLEQECEVLEALPADSKTTVPQTRDSTSSTISNNENMFPNGEERRGKNKKVSLRTLVKMKLLGKKSKKKFDNQRAVKRKPEIQYSLHSDSSTKSSQLIEESSRIGEEENHSELKSNEDSSHLRTGDKEQSRKKQFRYSPDAIHLTIMGDTLDNLDSFKPEKRRMAVCEELERSEILGEQNLYDLRELLVVQYKLNGFGLL